MDLANYLRRVKVKLGVTDTKEDELLTMLLEDAFFAIVTELQASEIPAQLQYIVEEIAIKRYRKIGSEGLTSEKIDVISNTFEEDPLQPYRLSLDTYKRNNKKLRML